MENRIGKICPFCKTELTESDAVTVCPACGIPHHTDCWNENQGCTTFGCSEQHYEAQNTNPTNVCDNCGAPMGDGQVFCSSCGTFKAEEPQKNVCGKCGNELQDGQVFCPKCGYKAGAVADNTVNNAISQFNAGITQKKTKSKALPIIISAVAAGVLAIAVVVGIFVFSAMRAKQAEEVKREYIENVEAFMALSLTAGSNLENITDTIQQYWYENIWEDKWGNDINDAIRYALIAMSDEIDQAEIYDTRMDTLYSKIKKVPDGLAKEDLSEIADLCEAAKDLYNVYTDLYDMATDPSGSYNSYSESNNTTTNKFVSCYRALDNLLE